jgi:hypothetical protein
VIIDWVVLVMEFIRLLQALITSNYSGFFLDVPIYLQYVEIHSIRMDLGEVGWGDVDWIGLAKDRNRWRALVNSVLNLRVP